MKKKLALFDLDKTITCCDSGQKFIMEWIRTHPGYAWKMVLAPFGALLWKLRLLKLATLKEFFFAFIKRMDSGRLDQIAKHFVEHNFSALCKVEALQQIKELQADGYTIVLASASPQFYVRYFAEKMGISLYAGTQYQEINGRYTGYIAGLDCRGKEKLSRIAALVRLEEYDLVASVAFSDSKADLPMLSLVGEAWFVANKKWELQPADEAVAKFKRLE